MGALAEPCPSCGHTKGRHTFACRWPFDRKRTQVATARDAPVVINRHHYRGKKMPQPWLYIGRNAADPSKSSPLANPFTVAEHGKAALGKYERWLRERVDAGDERVLAALQSITPAHALVCSCAPRPCHGDVVVEVWREVVGSRVGQP